MGIEPTRCQFLTLSFCTSYRHKLISSSNENRTHISTLKEWRPHHLDDRTINPYYNPNTDGRRSDLFLIRRGRQVKFIQGKDYTYNLLPQL